MFVMDELSYSAFSVPEGLALLSKTEIKSCTSIESALCVLCRVCVCLCLCDNLNK